MSNPQLINSDTFAHKVQNNEFSPYIPYHDYNTVNSNHISNKNLPNHYHNYHNNYLGQNRNNNVRHFNYMECCSVKDFLIGISIILILISLYFIISRLTLCEEYGNNKIYLDKYNSRHLIEENIHDESTGFMNYETPKSPVCLIKNKHNNLPKKNWNLEEICNELINTGNENLDIYSPSITSSFLLYKLAYICKIDNLNDIHIKNMTNNEDEIINLTLKENNKPSIGICSKDTLEKYINENVEPLIINGISCLDESGYYVMNLNFNLNFNKN
jgi:hypothetical protein